MDSADLSQDYVDRSIQAALAQLPPRTLYAVAYVDPRQPGVPVVFGNTIPGALLEVPDEVLQAGMYLVAVRTTVRRARAWKYVRSQNLDWFWPEALEGLARYAGQKVDAALAASMSRHPAGTKMSA